MKLPLVSALILAAATVLSGCSSVPAESAATAAVKPLASHSPSTTKAPTAPAKTIKPAPAVKAVAPVKTAASTGTSSAKLQTLAVKGHAPKTGYDRDQFGAPWKDMDHDGCDTRNQILARDLTDERFKPGTNNCKVLEGTLLNEPYTGASSVHFVAGGSYANSLDAEHIVALGDAWQKGAQQWDVNKRELFANDPLNLMMTDPSAKRAKGASDAAT